MKLDWALAAGRAEASVPHVPFAGRSGTPACRWLSRPGCPPAGETRSRGDAPEERSRLIRPTPRLVNDSPNWNGKPAILASRRRSGDRSPRSSEPSGDTYGPSGSTTPESHAEESPGSPRASGGLSSGPVGALGAPRWRTGRRAIADNGPRPVLGPSLPTPVYAG